MFLKFSPDFEVIPLFLFALFLYPIKKTSCHICSTTKATNWKHARIIMFPFSRSRRNTTKRIKEPEKHKNEKSVAYVATYNKNNPELLTEIKKNLEKQKQ